MTEENSNKSRLEEYAQLAKKSLVRIQYSCSGNTTPLEYSDFISYRTATVEDFPEIVTLLVECELPYSDIVAGKQNFIVAEIDSKTIGCAGFEAYNENGLFRSLAVKPLYRKIGIAQTLTDKALILGEEQGVKHFFLLTTTADSYFKKLGWIAIDRISVPDAIRSTEEFSSICPSTSTCMANKS